jgi:hypothetical protein
VNDLRVDCACLVAVPVGRKGQHIDKALDERIKSCRKWLPKILPLDGVPLATRVVRALPCGLYWLLKHGGQNAVCAGEMIQIRSGGAGGQNRALRRCQFSSCHDWPDP